MKRKEPELAVTVYLLKQRVEIQMVMGDPRATIVRKDLYGRVYSSADVSLDSLIDMLKSLGDDSPYADTGLAKDA